MSLDLLWSKHARLLDGDEALPLQALENRKRRRQWFTALAVMPAPVRDRYLDEGGRELGRCRLRQQPHSAAVLQDLVCKGVQGRFCVLLLIRS